MRRSKIMSRGKQLEENYNKVASRQYLHPVSIIAEIRFNQSCITTESRRPNETYIKHVFIVPRLCPLLTMGTSSSLRFLESVYKKFALSHKRVYPVHIGYGQCWTKRAERRTTVRLHPGGHLEGNHFSCGGRIYKIPLEMELSFVLVLVRFNRIDRID
jgi:hypothetical protein